MQVREKQSMDLGWSLAADVHPDLRHLPAIRLAIVGLQMIYAIAFFIALFLLEHNHYSVDRIVRGEGA
jgi:hypothetical protein